jgi:hypothetical protein
MKGRMRLFALLFIYSSFHLVASGTPAFFSVRLKTAPGDLVVVAPRPEADPYSSMYPHSKQITNSIQFVPLLARIP